MKNLVLLLFVSLILVLNYQWSAQVVVAFLHSVVFALSLFLIIVLVILLVVVLIVDLILLSLVILSEGTIILLVDQKMRKYEHFEEISID